MKSGLIGILIFVGAVASASIQVEIPSNPLVKPSRTDSRKARGGIEPGAKVQPDGAPEARVVTHIVLHDTRIWTSSDGKPVEAKLIAFEDLVSEGTKSEVAAEVPKPPAKPTVIQDEKVRLLVRGKPMTVAMERLSETDRELIQGIQTALLKKAEASASQRK